MGLRNHAKETFGIGLWELQVLSVMFWGTGEREKALNILKTAEAIASQEKQVHEESSFYSFWQGTSVSYDQFVEDCEEQQLMIRMGSSPPIRPPFLEDTFVI